MVSLKSLFSLNRKQLTDEQLATLEEQVEALAEAKIEGQADVDIKLAKLINAAPSQMRQEIAKMFEEQCQQVREDFGLAEGQELTPEQQQVLRQMRELEEQMVAHMLARKALRRIHALFLKNPNIKETILGIRQELHEKGVEALGVAGKAQQVSTVVSKDASKQKDSGIAR